MGLWSSELFLTACLAANGGVAGIGGHSLHCARVLAVAWFEIARTPTAQWVTRFWVSASPTEKSLQSQAKLDVTRQLGRFFSDGICLYFPGTCACIFFNLFWNLIDVFFDISVDNEISIVTL